MAAQKEHQERAGCGNEGIAAQPRMVMVDDMRTLNPIRIAADHVATDGNRNGGRKRAGGHEDAPRRKKVRFLSEIVSQPEPVMITHDPTPVEERVAHDDQAVPEINENISGAVGVASGSEVFPPRIWSSATDF